MFEYRQSPYGNEHSNTILGYLGTTAWFSHFPGFFNGFNLVQSLCVLLHLDASCFALVDDHTQRPVWFSQIESLCKHIYAQSTQKVTHVFAHTNILAEGRRATIHYECLFSMSNSDSLVHSQPVWIIMSCSAVLSSL